MSGGSSVARGGVDLCVSPRKRSARSVWRVGASGVVSHVGTPSRAEGCSPRDQSTTPGRLPIVVCRKPSPEQPSRPGPAGCSGFHRTGSSASVRCPAGNKGVFFEMPPFMCER